MSIKGKVLTRAKHGVISGTLTGFAKHFGISRGRLQFVFCILGLFGIGIIFYLILWASIPSYAQRDYLLAEQERKSL